MASWKTRLLAIVVIIIFTFGIGLYTGVKNSSDYQIKEFEFDEINANIQVYRDSNFVPTIVAENNFDLFFAQGYEMARDRLWQMTFYKHVGKGELSTLFGSGLADTDKYLKTLSLEIAAQNMVDKISTEYQVFVDAFIQGVNKYIELHQNNLPTEFTLLGIEPKDWTPEDVFLMQGILSQTLTTRPLEREVQRNQLALEFGAEQSTVLLPIDYVPARNYLFGLAEDEFAPRAQFNVDFAQFEYLLNMDDIAGSNNWVVGPSKSATGTPLIANDPHLSLSTPGIFWQVHLVSPDYHAQGVALPGVPGIIIGHNEHVSWGVTNSKIDALDLYYFKTNDQNQYWHDNQWKDFEVRQTQVAGEEFNIKYTEYGPVLDPDIFTVIDDVEDHVYTMRWTLLENYQRDQIFKSIFDLNTAEDKDDVREALRYFGVPGQNFVFATVDGDIGYQQTGIIPKRMVEGSAIIPQNGSNPAFGWNGTIDYEDQFSDYVVNSNYFLTANAKVDTRDDFYVAEMYSLDYRTQRIDDLLRDDPSVSLDDMMSIQDDTYNLYAEFILDHVWQEILNGNYDQDYDDEFDFALDQLRNWDLRMDRGTAAPSIFAIFRIFLEELTFKDEFDEAGLDYEAYSKSADYGITSRLAFPNDLWFDRVSTANIIEKRADIVEMAFEKTVIYLEEEVSSRTLNWRYEDVHEVVFPHPMGEELGILNEGGDGADGSEHTVKSSGTPDYVDGKPVLTMDYGSAIKFIAVVEPNWANSYLLSPPGQSEHFFVDHRDDQIDQWIEGELAHVSFSTEFTREPDFTYIKV